MNLPNVTLPNMSHLVYITFFGETDGVTLSRLGCSFKIHDSLLLKWKPLKKYQFTLTFKTVSISKTTIFGKPRLTLYSLI